MKKTEPDPSADVELLGMMMHVVVAFGIGLRLEETIANVGKEGVTVLQQCVHDRDTHREWLIANQDRRGPTVDHLERRCAEGRVKRRVEAILGLG